MFVQENFNLLGGDNHLHGYIDCFVYKDSALKTFEISAILLNCLDQKPLHKPNYDKI